MALEVKTIDGRRTAYIREESDIRDVRSIQGIEALWIMSECRTWVQEPLQLSDLKVLYVSSNTLPIIELVAVDCLANLDWLLVAASPKCLVGLSSLKPFRNLTRLKVRQQTLDADEKRWIELQIHVQFLSLTDVPIDDQSIASLSCKSSLRRLDVYSTNIRFDAPVLDGCRFDAVRSLDISKTQVGSDGVSQLCRSFPNLERLIATGTKLTMKDVSEIRGLPKLRILDTGFKELDFDSVNDPFWDL